jgi:RNA polymerase sigma-70 factor (ECF subfamily)
MPPLLNRKSSKIKGSSDVQEDEALVRRCQQGDEEAFTRIVERYQTRVVGLAYSVVRNPDDAMDVAQEAFLKVHRNLRGFRGKSSFYTWLYRVTVNLAIDRDRKRKRRRLESLEAIQERSTEAGGPVFPDEGPSPKEVAADGELEELVNEAIDSLSPRHRTVVLLRDVQGLSYQEIAEVVGCSLGTVMSRLHYARQKLKEKLRPLLGPEFQEEAEPS